MSQQIRPANVGFVGINKSYGLYVVNDSITGGVRELVNPDGFHFESYDFDGLILPELSFESPTGVKYSMSFNDDGALMINGVKYVSPTNQDDETVKGNKTYEGKTTLKGGLMLNDINGNRYSVTISTDGKLIATMEVN